MPGKCKFQDSWLYKNEWLLKVPSDIHSARCSVCLKSFKVDNMGESALVSHEKSNSLRRSAKEKKDKLKQVEEKLNEKLLELKNC